MMRIAVILKTEEVIDVVDINSIEKLSGFRDGIEQVRRKEGVDIECREVRVLNK